MTPKLFVIVARGSTALASLRRPLKPAASSGRAARARSARQARSPRPLRASGVGEIKSADAAILQTHGSISALSNAAVQARESTLENVSGASRDAILAAPISRTDRRGPHAGALERSLCSERP